MLYYANDGQAKFFESNCYNDKNRPRFKDIEFLRKTELSDILKDYKFIPDEIIPERLWNKLKEYIFFKDDGKKIRNLRTHAKQRNSKLKELIRENKVIPFEEFEYKGKNFIDLLRKANIPGYSSLYEYYKKGHNIGTCGDTALITASAIFDKFDFCKGKLPSLAGSENSSKGGHSWIKIVIDKKCYLMDTSLMLFIPQEYVKDIGYEEKRKAYSSNEIKTGEFHSDRENHIQELYFSVTCLKGVNNTHKPSYNNFVEAMKALENF